MPESVASSVPPRKRAYTELLRRAVSPADKEKLEKLHWKAKLLKQAIRTIEKHDRPPAVKEFQEAEKKRRVSEEKLDNLNSRLNSKECYLDEILEQKDALMEKMSDDIDAANQNAANAGQGVAAAFAAIGFAMD